VISLREVIFTFSALEIDLHGGGQLCAATCTSVDINESDEAIQIVTHWCVNGREFLGHIDVSTELGGFCWNCRIVPKDGEAWGLIASNEGSGVITGLPDRDGMRLFHGDNVRGVTQAVFLTEGTYFVSLDQWKQPLNAGRWQSFPGVWLTDTKNKIGVVCGVLSQRVWKHTLLGIPHGDNSIKLTGKIASPGINAKFFQAGQSYQSETLYFEITQATTPLLAFHDYLKMLETRLQPSSQRSTLKKGPLWGSWNDRQPHFWDVSMELIERMLPVLKDRFPSVKSLQIDDGYAFGGYQDVVASVWTNMEDGVDPSVADRKIQKVRRLGCGFAYEPERAIAKDRFPNGMVAATSAIDEAGYQAGIWLGLDVVQNAALVNAHPEWFINYLSISGDDPELYNCFSNQAINRTHVLDPSVPEVRDYLEKVFDILFKEWGFEAFKLDFWSYAFENEGFRLRFQNKTAFEWRAWFFETIRSYLPEETYFLIGCDISTGNPFLCEWVDSIRYGIDIGNGKWESICYSALTGTFLLHTGVGRFYNLDPDSVGLLKKLPEHQRRCFWAWCAVTRSLYEIAGDLAAVPREELRLLQKLFLAPKNGQSVRLCEQAHLERNEPAEILFAPGDLFSTTANQDCLPMGVLAVFNWSDEPRVVVVTLEQLGLGREGAFWDVDFFEPDTPAQRNESWKVCLPPNSVRLSHLSQEISGEPIIVDSDWAVVALRKRASVFDLTLHGDSEQGILLQWPFAHTPEIIKSNLPTVCERVKGQTFRVRPSLPEDRQYVWEISLSGR